MYQKPRFLCDDPEEFYHFTAFLFSDDLALPDHQAGLFYQCYIGFCIEVTEIHRRPEPFACPAGGVPASKAGKKYAPWLQPFGDALEHGRMLCTSNVGDRVERGNGIKTRD